MNYAKPIIRKMVTIIFVFVILSSAFAESINIPNISEATDEELKTAYDIIVAEQKSRIQASISFPEQEVSVGLGKTIKLQPIESDIPEGANEISCEWETSNKDIATVKDGNVKGISAGKCIVSCRKTYSDNFTHKCACIVSVDVPIKKITLPRSIIVGVKKTVKLDVKYTPEKATNTSFEYTSSDLSIAKVNKSGEITGVGQGSCTITVTAADSGSVSSDVKVRVPAVYSEKSEYTITSKKGLTVEFQCLNTSSDNISFNNSSKKLFSVENAEYNKSKGIPGLNQIHFCALYSIQDFKHLGKSLIREIEALRRRFSVSEKCGLIPRVILPDLFVRHHKIRVPFMAGCF